MNPVCLKSILLMRALMALNASIFFHRFVSLFTWMSLSDQACAFGRESVRNSADKWLLGRQITLKTKTMCVFKLIKTLAKHSPKRLGIARRHAQL